MIPSNKIMIVKILLQEVKIKLNGLFKFWFKLLNARLLNFLQLQFNNLRPSIA